MKRIAIRSAFLFSLAFAAAACEEDLPTSPITELEIREVEVGTGTEAVPGRRVTVHYTGYLYSTTAAGNRGERFDSSVLRGEPFSFVLGFDNIIEGWHQGIAGMKVGGRRTLVIPPELAYGRQGNGPIPPNAALVFDIELLGVQ